MKVLFVVPPLTGHVNPTVSVGTELTRRGHDVAWCGYPDRIAHLLPDWCPPAAGRRRDATPTLVAAVTEEGRGKRGASALKFLWEVVLLPLNRAMADGVRAAIRSYEPDVVVADQQAFVGGIVAGTEGIPWATSATTSAELTDPLADTPKIDAWVRESLVQIQVEQGVPAERAAELDPRFSPAPRRRVHDRGPDRSARRPGRALCVRRTGHQRPGRRHARSRGTGSCPTGRWCSSRSGR